MQTVGHLEEHHPYVLAHGEQELAEILGLGRGLVTENTTGNLGETLDDLGNLLAEMLLDVPDSELSVLNHIVEQGGAYRGGTEPDLT